MSENWPLKPEQLLAMLKDQQIAHTFHEHEAIYTVEQGDKIERLFSGAHCRNLFLRDKNKTHLLLVSLRNTTKLDLKKLGAALGVGRLSFGSPELLWEKLGVKPGSVCPYAILNNTDNSVRLILEAEMFVEEIVNFHPLVNTMTIGVDPHDLRKLLEAKKPELLDMATLAPDITA